MRTGHTLEELIFWHVYDRPFCQRSDLVQRFGVSPATISRGVNVLLERDLLRETAAGASAAGRKPQLLDVNPKLATLLGVEVDLDQVTAVVTDISGELLGRGSVRCDAGQGLDAVLRDSQTAVQTALEDAAVPRRHITHMGVGHPGDLDLEEGVCVTWANGPSWKDTPIRSRFSQAFSLQVKLDDRSRALALAERRTSPEDYAHPDAIYVFAGTGIGMGIFLEGRLFRGSARGGGELGHTVIDPNGPPCKCGNRGCVEAFSSIGAIVRQASRDSAGDSVFEESPPPAGSIEAVLAAARQGDPASRKAVERAAEALGIGVANTVQILNPSLVVLCGRLTRLTGEYLVQAVAKAVRTQCVRTSARKIVIRASRPKKDISAIGCALLAAEAEAQRVLLTRLSGEKTQAADPADGN